MAGPGVVALNAPNRRHSNRLVAVRVKWLFSPFVPRLYPSQGQFVKMVALPGEVHLVCLAAGAINHVDPLGISLTSDRQFAHGRFIEPVTCTGHFKVHLRAPRSVMVASGREPGWHWT